ncbi:hypothetical protein U6A24_11145 [Aquimarina gracilis]|uniref:Uncharacterized protein n=1 Tax=Aquimarina gracilis TaxID=874422 RepID=A0ABU5ZVZ0_9FLAO|nr:hypothetical protein [Aquimarina gracilis]MEB3346021.1 hypothetical protein [Aquimarina gracilis]
MLYLNSLSTISFKGLRDHYPVVHNSIKSYYPVGIPFKSELYRSHTGIKEIQDLINRNIVDKKRLESVWVNGFCEELGTKIDLPIVEATFGVAPSYAIRVVIEENKSKGESIELHCRVSLLNNFFNIQIAYLKDNMRIEREEKYLKEFVTLGLDKLVISPVKGYYKELFILTENLVREHFERANFLSTALVFLRLKGLTVNFNQTIDMPIGMAFFHNMMPLNYYKPKEIIGNLEYRIDECIKFKQ